MLDEEPRLIDGGRGEGEEGEGYKWMEATMFDFISDVGTRPGRSRNSLVPSQRRCCGDE